MQITIEKADWLKGKIRDIPDFPKPGIVFKDLTTLLKDAQALKFVVNTLAEHFAVKKPDYIAGIEARGFILAPAIAHLLDVGFIPVRKPGKLPHTVESVSYALEYGTDTLEVHKDAVSHGQKVVIIDDLLATGGTAEAAHDLMKKIGADIVGMGFVVELGFLHGREKLAKGVDVFSVIDYM